jgi:hypothetical protein
MPRHMRERRVLHRMALFLAAITTAFIIRVWRTEWNVPCHRAKEGGHEVTGGVD